MAGPDITIFHNPRRSKSRQALAVIEGRGTPHAVVEYLKTPPDRATLEFIPVVVHGDRVVIARPTERVVDLLG